MEDKIPVINYCSDIILFEQWKYYDIYLETVKRYNSFCDFEPDDFTIYICKSLNLFSGYDKENDYILFDTQLARLFLRCNALWQDKELQETEFFSHLCFLVLLHKTVVEELVFFTVAALDLFCENMTSLADERFWEDFDFDSVFKTTHIQNMITFGHEIYHRFLEQNPQKKDLIFNQDDEIINLVDNNKFQDYDQNLLEEGVCDWFAVKILLDNAKDEHEKNNIIQAYIFSLLNLSLLSLLKSLGTIPEDTEIWGKKSEKILQNLQSRINFFTEHLAYYSKANNEDILFLFFIKTASASLERFSSILKENMDNILDKFPRKVIEKNDGDFVKYYPKIGYRNKFNDSISNLTKLAQNLLLGKLDVFDCCIFPESEIS